MMRQLRGATKPIMIFTAAAFVGLMVFEWGMDITGRTAGGIGEIGSVNGEGVSYDAYMAAFRNLYDQAQRAQTEPLTSQQVKEIEDQAFDEVVTQILIQQELKRRGITVTTNEIREAARFSPPPELRSDFSDEAGNFDFARYQSFLAQLPQDQLALLEAYYRDVIPRGKLLRQVSSGIFLTDGELWKEWRDRTEAVEVQYVPLNPATRYADAEVTVEREEVERYYREHPAEFEMPGRATVKAVVLAKAPTAADTAATLERVQELRRQILAGEDFAAVAARESQDQATANLGGDLGTFGRGRMVEPFEAAVFAAQLGEVTEPVITPSGIHIIEVTRRWGADSAQARHILLPVERTEDSEIALLMRADSLEALATASGVEHAASVLGLAATTVDLTQTFPLLAGAGPVGEGADWAFEEAQPGDVSPAFENAQGFYVLELVEVEPAGLMPFADAAVAIEAQLRFERKLERAKEEGSRVAARARAGEPLPNVAADMGLEVRVAGPFTRNDFVPGLGRQNAAIGAAFALLPGQVSDAVATPANVFVIQALNRSPADSLAWQAQRDEQRRAAVSGLQQQRLQEWIEALRASAEIVDRRAEVLRPVDDTEVPQGLPPVF